MLSVETRRDTMTYLLAIIPLALLVALAYNTFMEYYTHKMENDNE
jgi:hypothetical protein